MTTIQELKREASQLGLSHAYVQSFGLLTRRDTWMLAVETHKIKTGSSSKQILSLLNEIENPQAKAELEPILLRLARMSASIDAAIASLRGVIQ